MSAKIWVSSPYTKWKNSRGEEALHNPRFNDRENS
jgi:hypothetical protein